MKIMVIGSNVGTVQLVSQYCLKQGAEVYPYYGIPTDEDITVFAPQILVLCLPLPEDFQRQINQPYILWSQQSVDIKLPVVSTPTELQARLQQVL